MEKRTKYRKIALVLSGGGAKGAFQIGALKYIHEEIIPRYPDFTFSIIAGVSVGSLNGIMLAQNDYDSLLELWNNLENRGVYRGKLSVAGLGWRLLRGKRSFLSYGPLEEKIEKHIHLERVNPAITFRSGSVSLITGEYYYFGPEQFSNSDDLRKAILASALMPVIWEPIARISSSAGVFKDMVDGGIRNNSPLKDVLEFDPDEVVIINCTPFKKPIKPDSGAARNIFQIAKRSLVEIAMNEIFLGDLMEYLTINRLVKQAKEKGVILDRENGRPYKAFKTVLISPVDPLGDVLNFEQSAIQPRLQKGYDAAKEAFKNYRPEVTEQLFTNLENEDLKRNSLS